MEKRDVVNVSSIIFLISFGFFYWGTFYEMVTDWYIDPNYSHGFLIPLISGYLFWQRKDAVKSVVTSPSNFGFFIFILGLGMYFFGNLSAEYFTIRISMLFVLAGTLIFTFGMDLFKAVLFPFFYLLFMIPLPYIFYDTVAFPLKLFVSKVSVAFLTSLGVLVLREGNIIHFADTTLEVADACSGIRSIISLLALSTALAYMTQNGWIKRAVLITIAVPIAVLVNAIRVVGTGILADQYGSQVAEGFFHEFAGLLIFGAAIMLLIFSAFILRKARLKK